MRKSKKITTDQVVRRETIVPMPDWIIDWDAMPDGVEKRTIMTERPGPFEFADIIEIKSGAVFLSVKQIRLKAGNRNSLFLSRKAVEGITMIPNVETRFWFNKKLTERYMQGFFKFIKKEWIDYRLYDYMTNSLMKKVCDGKITNPIDLCKEYLKLNRIKASAKLFYKAILIADITKHEMYKAMMNAKNVDHLFQRIIRRKEVLDYLNSRTDQRVILYEGYQLGRSGNTYAMEPVCTDFHDIMQQCFIFNRKISFAWSDKRIIEEHWRMTRNMAEEKAKLEPDHTIDMKKIQSLLPKHINILTNSRQTFMIGKSLRHCIYSSYWNRIKKIYYIAFHYSHSDGDFVVGCHARDDGELHLDQARGMSNSFIPESYYKDLIDILDSNASKVPILVRQCRRLEADKIVRENTSFKSTGDAIPALMMQEVGHEF